jgi:hypothetical protein
MLATCARVLRDVHGRFFSGGGGGLAAAVRGQRDVRACLAAARREVLGGVEEDVPDGVDGLAGNGVKETTGGRCVLVFSRCWPQAAQARSQPLWLLAESLGAVCEEAYDPARTTHVIVPAPSGGRAGSTSGGAAGVERTNKVAAALADGKHVVVASWLHACMFRWQRVPEAGFVAVALQRAAAAVVAADAGAG